MTRAVADGALQLLDVDAAGLDQMDRRYLDLIAASFGGGPVGIETIAAALPSRATPSRTSSSPILIQQGFLQRTPRGRMLTAARLPPPRPRPSRQRDPAAQLGFSARRGVEDG